MMSIWTIAIYELKRYWRMKFLFVMLIITPLLLIFILGSALSEDFRVTDRAIEPLDLYLYDADAKEISFALQQFLETEPIKEMIHVHYVDSIERVEEAIKEREGQFGLMIPHGFNEAVMSRNEAELKLFLGYSQVKNRTAETIIRSFLDELNRVQATGAVVAALSLGKNMMEESALSSSTSQDYVISGKLHREKDFSAVQYYTSTMLIMFLLYTGLTAAISLVEEREKHTLERLHSLPITSYHIFLGKLLGNVLLAFIQAGIILVFTAMVYDVDWGESIGYIILILLLTIFASMGMALLVSFIFHNVKTLGSVFSAFIGVMTFIAGGMVPHTEGVFATLQQFTVNYWAHQGLIQLMLGQEPSHIYHNLLYLFAIGLTLTLCSIGFYRKAGYNE